MMEMIRCVRCGGTVAPDGRCWDCGEAQPAFRSHLEITADDGAAGVSDRGLRRGIWAGWIGDSRAYWLPDEGPGMALTEDDTGEHEVLAAWLGADAGEPVPRIRSYRPSGPGRLLLCTDGLWRYLPDADRLRARLGHRSSAAEGGLLADARTLVAHALDAGGHDNVTALLSPVRAAVPTASSP